MELEVFLALMGCKTLDEAADKVKDLNVLVTDLRAATGEAKNADALKAVTANASIARHVEALTGKQGVACLGVVNTWKSSSEELVEAQKTISANKKANEQREVKDLLDEACASGRLEPAKRAGLEANGEKFGPEFVKAAIEALPPATERTPGERPVNQPADRPLGSGATPAGGNRPASRGAPTDSEKAVMKATNKTLEEVREAVDEWNTLETRTPDGQMGVFISARRAAPARATA